MKGSLSEGGRSGRGAKPSLDRYLKAEAGFPETPTKGFPSGRGAKPEGSTESLAEGGRSGRGAKPNLDRYLKAEAGSPETPTKGFPSGRGAKPEGSTRSLEGSSSVVREGGEGVVRREEVGGRPEGGVPLTPGGLRDVRKLLVGKEGGAADVLRSIAEGGSDPYAAEAARFLLNLVGSAPGLSASKLAEVLDKVLSDNSSLNEMIVSPDYLIEKCWELNRKNSGLIESIKERAGSYSPFFLNKHGLPRQALESLFSVLGEDLKKYVKTEEVEGGNLVIVKGRDAISKRIKEKGFTFKFLSKKIGVHRNTFLYALGIAGVKVVDSICELLKLPRVEVDRNKAKALILIQVEKAINAPQQIEGPQQTGQRAGVWWTLGARVTVDEDNVARSIELGDKKLDVNIDLKRRHEPTDREAVKKIMEELRKQMGFLALADKYKSDVKKLRRFYEGTEITLSGVNLVRLIVLSMHFLPQMSDKLVGFFKEGPLDIWTQGVSGELRGKAEAHPLTRILKALKAGEGMDDDMLARIVDERMADDVLAGMAGENGGVARAVEALRDVLSGLKASEAAEILEDALQTKEFGVLASNVPVPEEVLEKCARLKKERKIVDEELELNDLEYRILMLETPIPVVVFDKLIELLGEELREKVKTVRRTPRRGKMKGEEGAMVVITRGREELARKVMNFKGGIKRLGEVLEEKLKEEKLEESISTDFYNILRRVIPFLNPEKLYSLCRMLGLPDDVTFRWAMSEDMLRRLRFKVLIKREAEYGSQPSSNGEWSVFTVNVKVEDGVARRIGDMEVNIPLNGRFTVDPEAYMKFIEEVWRLVGEKFESAPSVEIGLDRIHDHYFSLKNETVSETSLGGEDLVKLIALLQKVKPEMAEKALSIISIIKPPLR
ncbi:MAG: hypothetical protein QW689_05585 [Nitrososphaerota archaeon]